MVTRRQFLAAAGLLAGTLYTRRYVEANPGFGAMTSLTNRNTYTLPTAPTLPGIGGSFTDPTTGVKIIQLTDPTTDDDTQTGYSYWASMNSDYTRFMLHVDTTPAAPANAVLWNFNAATEVPTRVGDLFTTFLFDIGALGVWSWTENNVIYGAETGSTVLRKMVLTSDTGRTYSVLKDFAGLYSGFTSLWQMTMSGDNNFFCFAGKSGAAFTRVIVWDRVQDLTYLYDISAWAGFDEAYIDLSGTYVVISSTTSSEPVVWKFVPNTTHTTNTNMAHGCIHNLKHFANTNGTPLGPATWDLTQTTDPIVGVANFDDWYSGIDKHSSWLTPGDATWCWMETLKDTTPWTEYQNEIIRVKTNASYQWRRLAHHRSDLLNTTNYYRSTPKGNISQDGRWYFYTTNWDNTRKAGVSYHYGMLLKVPTEAEFAAGDYGGGCTSVTAKRPCTQSRPAATNRPPASARPPVTGRPNWE